MPDTQQGSVTTDTWVDKWTDRAYIQKTPHEFDGSFFGSLQKCIIADKRNSGNFKTESIIREGNKISLAKPCLNSYLGTVGKEEIILSGAQ